MPFNLAEFQKLSSQITKVASPTIAAPLPTPLPSSIQPTTGVPAPSLPMLAPQPSTAMYVSGPTPSSSFTDFGAAPTVQAAAISPDPTALTGDTLTPTQQSDNRAQLIKMAVAVAAIWLILSATGR